MFGDNYTETYSTSKMHTKGTELFSNLEVTVMEHIKQYEKKIGKIPNRVIFYRDGVGEDFINRLREHEIVPIQKALKQQYPKKTPKLVFILLTKRIDERFAEMKQKLLVNPRDGIIIEDERVETEPKGFFMIS